MAHVWGAGLGGWQGEDLSVSTGHLWQKHQFWPPFGDLGQMGFSKQLSLLGEANRTPPSSEQLGGHVSTSLGTGSQHLFTCGPGRASLWSPGRGTRLRHVGVPETSPLGRRGYEHSVLASRQAPVPQLSPQKASPLCAGSWGVLLPDLRTSSVWIEGQVPGLSTVRQGVRLGSTRGPTGFFLPCSPRVSVKCSGHLMLSA